MDEQVLFRLLAGGFGSGLDVTALIAFIAFAAVYFIAPAIGYTSERPAGLSAALYVLIGYTGLSLFQLFVQWIQVLDRVGAGAFPGAVRGGGESGVHFIFIFAALKIALFLVAMVAFVTGLRSLRLRRSELPGQPGEDRVQQLREENARLRRKLEQRAGRGEEQGTQEGR
jgi:hypothetical protein